MNVYCSTNPCPILLNAACVFYQGANLIYTGINTNDNLQIALEKIDARFSMYMSTVNVVAPLQKTGTVNILLSIPQATSLVDGYLDSADWSVFNSKQNAITLTTTGSSGVSTFISSTLNIPNYTLSGLGGNLQAVTDIGSVTTNVITAAGFTLPAQPIGLSTYRIRQVMATNDYWSIYGFASVADYGDLFFELQDNAAFADGQRFRFHYGNDSSGTPKDILLMDYNGATIDGTLQVNNLAGIGTRMVVANSIGLLSTQVITTGTVTSIATSGPITGGPITSSGTIGITQSSASLDGYLSSTDWSIFNGKQNQLNGTGFVKASGTTITYDNSTYYLASNPNNYIPLTALSSTATGLTYTNTTGVFSLTAGYIIPTTTEQSNWNTAYTNRITSLTTTGSSGVATLITNVLNIPNYTLSGLGGVPTSRTLTINGTSYDLSADRSWTVVTGIAIGNTITSATAGSVLFAGTSGVLQQDNANFFWDNTNNRLGIGTNAPAFILDTRSDIVINGWVIGKGSNTSLNNLRITDQANTSFNNITTANNNIFIGRNTGLNLTTGIGNVSLGQSAGQVISSGNYNFSLGNLSAVRLQTGENNISIGTESLLYIVGQSNNIALGYRAGAYINGYTNATPSSSIYIGNSCFSGAVTASNEIVIGNGTNTIGLGSNTTIIGNSSTVTTALRGNLLLGTTTDSGLYKLDVVGAARLSVSGTSTGIDTIFRLENTTTPTAVGQGAAQDFYLTNGSGVRTLTSRIASVWSNTGVSINFGDLVFSTTNYGTLRESLRISGIGNVSIPIPYTGGTLNVAGTIGFSWVQSGSSTAVAVIGSGNTGGSLFVNTASGVGNSTNNQYNAGLVIDGTNAGAVSTINIKAYGPRNTGASSILTFSTSIDTTLTEKMRLTAAGRLLLGTTSESTYIFDVVGNERITGNSTVISTTASVTAAMLGWWAVNGYVTTTIPASTSFSGAGYGFSSLIGNNYMTYAGSATFAADTLTGSVLGINNFAFTAAASTLTMTQGGSIRTYSGGLFQNTTSGSVNGTITHLSGLAVRPLYRASGSSTVTVTNNYGLLINNQNEYSHATITNRWGVYQEGALDSNYFAGKTIIGPSNAVGGATSFKVTGLPTSSAGLSTGDVWNNGGVLTIV
jgi:hypothetical protein